MVACPGCKRDFKSSASLSCHKRFCSELSTVTASILQKRRHNKEKFVAAKIQRLGEEEDTASRNEVRDGLGNDDDLYYPQSSDPFPVREPTPLPEFRPSGLRKRNHRLPKRYRDDLPPAPAPIPAPLPEPEPDSDLDSNSPESDSSSITVPVLSTPPNDYGIFRIYSGQYPTHNPDEISSIETVCDSPNLNVPVQDDEVRPWWSGFGSAESFFAPFLNATTFRLMHWFYSGSNQKSLAELDRLVNNVILAEDFDKDDLKKFSAAGEGERLDKHKEDVSSGNSAFSANDGWINTSVKIRLPAERVKHISEETAPEFEVQGLHYRRPLEVLKAAFKEVAANRFHLTPFKTMWKTEDGAPAQRIYGDIYNSDAMIDEHEAIRTNPPNPTCKLETVIGAIMLWSDSTHLTSFGTASLWPIYLFLGNQSKYTRGKPSAFAAHHLAYIPKLTDTIQDFYSHTFNKTATAAVLTHCKRELMHAIWLLLLDPEFLHAYEFGIVIEFMDGVLRRFFPRFFTYSADYPERVLLACIKFLSQNPCPRCLTLKTDIFWLGTKLDKRRREKVMRIDNDIRKGKIERVREWIFKCGFSLLSKYISRLLGPESLVPTRNAFSERLSKFGFNFYSMFVPDLLHEFELGVWKAIFKHLLRILYAFGGDTIQILNHRFRQVPTFGRDTIRRFHSNASAMKKLAGRDFEDLLQCAIPVFEGLLPAPHNEIVLTLLFELATWHALAKLRLHTETTLNFMDTSTTRLGQQLRRFASQTCSAFVTRDLPQEEAARGRRKAAMAAKNPDKTQAAPKQKTQKQRNLNLSTFKLHSLGDYIKSIRLYGTTDNFTTQIGELEHRRVKRFYPRAHKTQFAKGIAKHQRRERLLFKMNQRHPQKKSGKATSAKKTPLPSTTASSPWLDFVDNEPLPYTAPEVHHHISASLKHHENISAWLSAHSDDPAFKNFLPRLKDHLLARLLGRVYNGDEATFTPAERNTITFVNNRLYKHKVLRVNYTTYDLRRSQDSLNPRTHADFMVLSHEEDENGKSDHPYWYGRIIGIFHVLVQQLGPMSQSKEPKRMEFLWVRWFGREMSVRSGWKAKRLHRIGFLDSDDVAAFGFLDPNLLIRGVHLIPAFHYGRTSALLPPSIVRNANEKDEDWLYYYINMFVDRDMFLRFRGGGVGHKAIRESTQCCLDDLDVLDQAWRDEMETHSDSGDVEDSGANDTRNGGELAEPDRDAEEEVEEVEDLGIEDEMEDYGYDVHEKEKDSEDEEEGDGDDNDDDDDDGLDPEDGEGPPDDAEGMEGYGAL